MMMWVSIGFSFLLGVFVGIIVMSLFAVSKINDLQEELQRKTEKLNSIMEFVAQLKRELKRLKQLEELNNDR